MGEERESGMGVGQGGTMEASSAESYPSSCGSKTQHHASEVCASYWAIIEKVGALLEIRDKMSPFSKEAYSLLEFSTGYSGSYLVLPLLCCIGLGPKNIPRLGEICNNIGLAY